MARRRWQLLANSVLTSALMMHPPSWAESFASNMICSDGVSETPCVIGFNNNTTVDITFANGNQLIARRLGRWSIKMHDETTQRSCNVRIDLGDEVVYGLLQISASKGAQLTWSRGQITIPGFRG